MAALEQDGTGAGAPGGVASPVKEAESTSSGGDGAAPDPYKHLARLYVASIPKNMNEAQLKPLFDQWGNVRDVMILRERSTGVSRGCAFVGYEAAAEAQAAIQHLDRRVHLPGASGPLEVRFARGRQSGSGGAEDCRQLLFSGAPPAAAEADLQALFGSHGGTVESISLTKDPEGSGAVTMSTRQEAAALLEALDGKHAMDGAPGPLSLKWAEEPRAGRRAGKAAAGEGGGGGGGSTDDRTVFFARVLRSATEEAVRALFSQYGRVVEINLFRAFQGAPTSKGCGLATMATADEASAAIAGLHEQHVWQGMAQPMVVRWMDSALQRRRREEHLVVRQAALAQVAPPGLSGPWGLPPPSLAAAAAAAGGYLPVHGPAPGAGLTAGLLAAHAGGMGLADVSQGALFPAMPTEVPPPGCAPDAYKLFVGNVPSCYTERDLRPLFESVGPIAELVVLYDKQTGASKGSAFVWYATRSDADRAAAQFNDRHLLPDPTGHQQRPLVVRPATMRRAVPRAVLLQHSGGALGGGGGGGGAGALGVLGAAAGGGAAGLQQHLARGVGVGMGAGVGGGMGGSLGAPGLGRVMHPVGLAPQHAAISASVGMDSGGGFGSSSFILDSSAALAAAAAAAAGAPLGPQDNGGADLGGFASGGFAISAAPPQPQHAGGGGSGPDSGSYAIFSGANALSGSNALGNSNALGGANALSGSNVLGGGGAGSGGNAGGGGGGGPWDPAGPAPLQYVPMHQPGGLASLQQQQHEQQPPQQQQRGPALCVPGAGLSSSGNNAISGDAASGGGGVLSVSVPVLSSQVQAVTPHVFDIQSASGADVSTHAVAPGVFCLRVTGSKPAVDTASQLISSLLQGAT